MSDPHVTTLPFSPALARALYAIAGDVCDETLTDGSELQAFLYSCNGTLVRLVGGRDLHDTYAPHGGERLEACARCLTMLPLDPTEPLCVDCARTHYLDSRDLLQELPKCEACGTSIVIHHGRPEPGCECEVQ